MSDGWFPGAKKLHITTNEYYTRRAVPLVSIVNHITDGTDSRDWLQHAANQSSVHFLIRDEGGQGVVYQFMPVQWGAWGNGRTSPNNPFMPVWVKNLIGQGVNINHATVSIEHERKWPFTTPPSKPMLDASIALHKWLAANYPTIKVDRTHIIGHYQIDHVSRAHCPGGPDGLLFPFNAIIQAVKGTPPPAPAPDMPIHFPETGQSISGGFKTKWLEYGLSVLGYPITGEFQQEIGGKSYTFQKFERVVLQWSPGQPVTFSGTVARAHAKHPEEV